MVQAKTTGGCLVCRVLVVVMVSLGVAGFLLSEAAANRRLVVLTTRFQTELDRAQLTPKDFEVLELLASDIVVVNPSQGDSERGRLHERFAGLIDETLRTQSSKRRLSSGLRPCWACWRHVRNSCLRGGRP